MPPIPKRTILYALSICIVCIIGAFIYYNYNPNSSLFFPKCPFLVLTGYKCPGCGSQRAIHALLHANLREAFSYNAFMILSLPYILLLLVAKVVQWKNPHSSFPLKVQTAPIIWSYFTIAVLFWITRNIGGF